MASSQKSTPRNSTPRNPNYTDDEDINLCQVYMEISQDAEISNNQSGQEFWKRVMELYNSEKPPSHANRNQRSVECRMGVILSAISKFKGCVQQIEYLNPSGASEKDIITKAKEIMVLDPKYSKGGFKFDHVWSLMKDFVKFDCSSQKSRRSSFESETMPPTPLSSDGLSDFSINLSDGGGSGSTSSRRPEGMKKTKNKRKMNEGMSCVLGEIRDGNQKLHDLMQSFSTQKDFAMQVQLQRIEAQKENAAAKRRLAEETRWAEDNKILLIDTDTISDPIRREYLKKEQGKIISKREEQSRSSFNMFGDDFDGLGGSGSGLGSY